MTSVFKTFFLLVFLMLGAMAPEWALAQSANPPGATDWDLYVYGNGRIVFDILMGIKMLMVPDSGETGFRSLLLVMATIGFLVLAIAAGFDPGKNLLKMFGYILVVWLVTFGSTQLTANVVIIDLARGTDGVAASEPYRVSGAPALVVLPAALTSEIGHYFTRIIETYFTIPGEFKLSGAGVGQFNLFGKMMAEATQYVITNPELKRSLAAYTADCVVPAMALGRLKGPAGSGEDGQPLEVSGTQALLRTSDMATTLSSAANGAILTKYFPFSLEDTTWMSLAQAELGEMGKTQQDLNQYTSSGALLSCATAWTLISTDMENHAQLLLNAGADSWAKSGVMVPFETTFSAMLAEVSAPGGMVGARWSRPSGFVLQQAMVNSMNGSFRQAAVQTGNNELMQAAALSQAEQMQKSAWVAGFSVFNNMMGYVFTVLQAFIFALTPLIVIALMVPGIGKSIFVNYAQVLIWLTLWQPMLALINFIILLFATESISTTLSMEGGISMANKALLSEKTNDLMIAAGFLGTMTPLLSWGIVKGAMAFTEFISKGVGSEFASQAGATSATGNLSMGNLSMDNTSMNKFSSAQSSQVGDQGVATGISANAMTSTQDGGGANTKLNGATVDMKQQAQDSLTESIGHAQQVSKALTDMRADVTTQAQALAMSKDSNLTSAQQEAAGLVYQVSKSGSFGTGATSGSTSAQNEQTDAAVNQNSATGFGVKGDVHAGFSPGGAGAKALGVEAGGGFSGSMTTQEGNARSEGAGASNMAGDNQSADNGSYKRGDGASEASSFQNTESVGGSQSTGKKASEDTSVNFQQSITSALAANEAYSKSLQEAHTQTSSFGYSGGTDLGMVNEQIQGMQDRRASMAAEMYQNQTGAGAMRAQLESRRNDTTTLIQERQDLIQAAGNDLGARPGGVNTSARTKAEKKLGEYEKGVREGQDTVAANKEKVKDEKIRRMQGSGAPKVGKVNGFTGNTTGRVADMLKGAQNLFNK
jgi:hypothetical protein